MLIVDEVRLTKDALRYGYAVGKVKVLQTKTLNASAYERLLDAPNFTEQKRLLSETPYGQYVEGAQTAEDVERGLDEALEFFYRFLDQAALPDPVTRFFRIRYDFSNFKAMAKARLLEVSEEGLLVDHGTIPREVFSEDLSALPEPFASLASKLTLDGESSSVGTPEHIEADTAAVDTMVDQAMFAELLTTAQKSKSRFLVDLACLAIDLANVKTLLRGRRSGFSAPTVSAMLIPGGTVELQTLRQLIELEPEDIVTAIERIPSLRSLGGASTEGSGLDESLDRVTALALRKARMGQVGPEPVIAYVLEREAEVATLRVLLLGKLTGIDDETLRRHVGVRG